jgi:hypothetical protein
MIVSELQALLAAAPAGDQVLVSSPANPVLNTILALATVNDTVSAGGTFTLRLSPISTTFRIRAPFDIALNVLLNNANIVGVDTTTEPGISSFKIDT